MIKLNNTEKEPLKSIKQEEKTNLCHISCHQGWVSWWQRSQTNLPFAEDVTFQSKEIIYKKPKRETKSTIRERGQVRASEGARQGGSDFGLTASVKPFLLCFKGLLIYLQKKW